MKKRLGLPILMGRPPRGVKLTSTGYVLLDGTPYDSVKRKQENERAKAERKKLRKEHVEDKEQEATVADEEEEDDVEDDVEDEEDEEEEDDVEDDVEDEEEEVDDRLCRHRHHRRCRLRLRHHRRRRRRRRRLRLRHHRRRRLQLCCFKKTSSRQRSAHRTETRSRRSSRHATVTKGSMKSGRRRSAFVLKRPMTGARPCSSRRRRLAAAATVGFTISAFGSTSRGAAIQSLGSSCMHGGGRTM